MVCNSPPDKRVARLVARELDSDLRKHDPVAAFDFPDYPCVSESDSREMAAYLRDMRLRGDDDESDSDVEGLIELGGLDRAELLDPPEKSRRTRPGVQSETDTVFQSEEIPDSAPRDVRETMDGRQVRERLRGSRIDS